MASCSVRIQCDDFDVAEIYRALRAPGHGAIVVFTGLVRDFNDTGEVTALELEHYPDMAEESITRTLDEACRRWPVEELRVIHRVGRLEPGDQIVLVAAAGAHRHGAFSACEFVMDYLKTSAPIWKKEFGAGGGKWVEAHDGDQRARDRWVAKEDAGQ